MSISAIATEIVKVASEIRLPSGRLTVTMSELAPTVAADASFASTFKTGDWAGDKVAAERRSAETGMRVLIENKLGSPSDQGCDRA